MGTQRATSRYLRYSAELGTSPEEVVLLRSRYLRYGSELGTSPEEDLGPEGARTTGGVSAKPAPASVDAKARAPARAEKKLVALQAAGRGAHSLMQQTASRQSGPMDAGWFGDFSQGESTFTEDGADAYLDEDPAREAQFGWDMGTRVISPKKWGSASAAWFAESPSAGQNAAWQTHFPAVSGSIAGNRDTRNNVWRQTPEGWVQNYNPAPVGGYAERRPGAFFDSNVDQFDGFGRQSMPYPGTQRSFLDSTGGAWTERTAKTNISCAELGCTANATVEVFNVSTEQAAHCRLDIAVHATDYDDEWSHEYIKFWKVNGFLVQSHCDPMAKGCNATAGRFLYPCVNGFPADNLAAAGHGAFHVQGSINRMVDDCPYEGNLLSGEISVTCMVRPKPTSMPPMAARELESESIDDAVIEKTAWLRCSTPGCTAQVDMFVDPRHALQGGECTLNVTLAQTDFDQDYEELEFLALEGKGNLSTNVQVGKNPCVSRDGGKPLPEEEQWYALVSDRNVTAELLEPPIGVLHFQGKISEQVDECGRDGALLDAQIFVQCTPPPRQEQSEAPKAAQREKTDQNATGEPSEAPETAQDQKKDVKQDENVTAGASDAPKTAQDEKKDENVTAGSSEAPKTAQDEKKDENVFAGSSEAPKAAQDEKKDENVTAGSSEAPKTAQDEKKDENVTAGSSEAPKEAQDEKKDENVTAGTSEAPKTAQDENNGEKKEDEKKDDGAKQT